MKNLLFTLIVFLFVSIQNNYASGDVITGNNVLNVYDFGASGQGTELDTKAIQAAIDKSAETGGTVLFPKGVFLTGTIYLKDNTSIANTVSFTNGAIKNMVSTESNIK